VIDAEDLQWSFAPRRQRIQQRHVVTAARNGHTDRPVAIETGGKFREFVLDTDRSRQDGA
jgi:hypothetical protein